MGRGNAEGRSSSQATRTGGRNGDTRPARESSLQILRNHTGEAGGPDLGAAVGRLDLPAIDRLVEELLADPPAPTKVAPRDEVWPLVNARASTISRGFGSFADAPGPAGLNLSAAMDPRQVGGNMFSDGVVRAADLYHGNPVKLRAISRKFVEAAAVSMAEIEGLLDAGIVETFIVSGDDRQAVTRQGVGCVG